jgi:hypothetical protein
MPAPQASMMKQLCRLKFSQNGLKMPDKWQAPSGDPGAEHYAKDYVQSTGSPDTTAPPLFMAASMTKDHTDTQKKINKVIGDYLDGIITAICSAWSTWQSAATLVGVTIAGPVASAGQVVGPPLTPLILAQGPVASPMELKYTTTIATVIGTSWLSYTAGIKVPGMPWYPAFAAFPGPVTPPTPNVPTPLIAISTAAAAVGAAAMKGQMIGQHGDPMAQWHKEIFDAVTDAFEKCHKIWEPSTQVMNVLGTGPVPSFAPPYVPVGPVVGGVGTMTPGGFT